MRTSKRKLKTVALRVARDPKRSPLFHWMLENFEALEPGVAGRRSDWAPLRAEAIARGITDDDGNDPSERTVRDTMRKVRQEVAIRREASGRKTPSAVYPSRFPATWRPPIETPRPPPSPRAVSSNTTVPAPSAPPEMNEAARATLASLRAQLDHADRYVRPRKREE